MITLGSFKDISDEYDEIWLIVRSLQNTPYIPNTAVYHVPALSPSPELFHDYLAWRDAGMWNKDMFEKRYKPRFLEEMNNTIAKTALNTLKRRSKDKHILLACYCRDEEMCHRSLVYELVQQKQETFYLLIAGSRRYANYREMCQVTDFLLKNQVAQGKRIVIVSGGAKGADTMAERYAKERGYHCEIFPAKWYKDDGSYDNSAGYRRNENMHLFLSSPSDNERGCVCFWDMTSPGTRHNFGLSLKHSNPLRVYDIINHRFLSEEEVKEYS